MENRPQITILSGSPSGRLLSNLLIKAKKPHYLIEPLIENKNPFPVSQGGEIIYLNQNIFADQLPQKLDGKDAILFPFPEKGKNSLNEHLKNFNSIIVNQDKKSEPLGPNCYKLPGYNPISIKKENGYFHLDLLSPQGNTKSISSLKLFLSLNPKENFLCMKTLDERIQNHSFKAGVHFGMMALANKDLKIPKNQPGIKEFSHPPEFFNYANNLSGLDYKVWKQKINNYKAIIIYTALKEKYLLDFFMRPYINLSLLEMEPICNQLLKTCESLLNQKYELIFPLRAWREIPKKELEVTLKRRILNQKGINFIAFNSYGGFDLNSKFNKQEGLYFLGSTLIDGTMCLNNFSSCQGLFYNG